MTSILEGVVKEEQEKIKTLKCSVAGKTGTTNNNFDAWFHWFCIRLSDRSIHWLR